MAEGCRASLDSQLGGAPCAAEDTEEIFWLRRADDCQSRLRLGGALSAQYRFQEAAAAFESALRIRDDDWKLWRSLSGANLTLRRFSQAREGYRRCLSLGADEKEIAFPLGVAAYLQKDPKGAARWFEKCLPCDDEMLICAVYWHTLASLRSGTAPALLSACRPDMRIGHHGAYLRAVSVFRGEAGWEEAASRAAGGESDLDCVITLYGIIVYLEQTGRKEEGRRLMPLLLRRESVWPCVPYLAAWGDCLREGPALV